MLNFVRARVDVFGTFTSMPQHPSLPKKLLFVWPNLASGLNPSQCASASKIGRPVNFSKKKTELTRTVFGGPCFKVLPNFHGFCKSCNIAQSNELFVFYNICFFRQLLRLILFSLEFAEGRPLLSAHVLLTSYLHMLMLVLLSARAERLSATGTRDELTGSEAHQVKTIEATS